MRYYAVIDTNVLVSAMLKWNSVPGMVVQMIYSGVITPVWNDRILSEYREVLSRPKFHLSQDVIDTLMDGITDSGLCVDEEPLDITLPDPKDRVFYEVVMEERKEEDAYLVMGNMKHFPSAPFIVTPRQMIDIILKDI